MSRPKKNVFQSYIINCISTSFSCKIKFFLCQTYCVGSEERTYMSGHESRNLHKSWWLLWDVQRLLNLVIFASFWEFHLPCLGKSIFKNRKHEGFGMQHAGNIDKMTRNKNKIKTKTKKQTKQKKKPFSRLKKAHAFKTYIQH